MLSRRAEEVLSYFTGLAPVGETFEVPMTWVWEDLGFNQKTSFYKYFNMLMRQGFIRRVASGWHGSIGVIVVLKRLESLPPSERQPEEPRWELARHKMRKVA